MEPITVLSCALLAGAAVGVEATAEQAIKDSYEGLKTMLIYAWKKKTDSSDESNEANYLLESFEKDPEVFEAPLVKKISENVDLTDEIILKAQELLRLTDSEGYSSGKYNINISDAKGVQVGDNNVQHNTFN